MSRRDRRRTQSHVLVLVALAARASSHSIGQTQGTPTKLCWFAQGISLQAHYSHHLYPSSSSSSQSWIAKLSASDIARSSASVPETSATNRRPGMTSACCAIAYWTATEANAEAQRHARGAPANSAAFTRPANAMMSGLSSSDLAQPASTCFSVRAGGAGGPSANRNSAQLSGAPRVESTNGWPAILRPAAAQSQFGA